MTLKPFSCLIFEIIKERERDVNLERIIRGEHNTVMIIKDVVGGEKGCAPAWIP